MPTSYLSPKLEIRAAPEKGGFAVFCRQPLQKDEVICAWSGVVQTEAQLRLLPPEALSHTVQIDEGLFLASLGAEEEPADYINHSCNPNAGVRGQISLVAMRPILPGEEITFDYAMTDSTPFDEFPCACGAPQCRGQVRGDDWQRPELWQRYEGYFSAYLQARIHQHRKNHV